MVKSGKREGLPQTLFRMWV